jgi:hypothetical protein
MISGDRALRASAGRSTSRRRSSTGTSTLIRSGTMSQPDRRRRRTRQDAQHHAADREAAPRGRPSRSPFAGRMSADKPPRARNCCACRFCRSGDGRFPESMTPLAVGQERSVKLIDDVVSGERMLALSPSATPRPTAGLGRPLLGRHGRGRPQDDKVPDGRCASSFRVSSGSSRRTATGGSVSPRRARGAA